MDWSNWTAATKKHYGYESLSELQVTWLDWVRRGSPPVQPKTTMVAAQEATGNRDIPVRTVSLEQPSPGTPQATEVAVSDPAGDSWYARQSARGRNESAVQTRGLIPSSQSLSGRGSGVPGSARSSSLTRPQPVGTPEATVIQWTSDPSSPSAPGGNIQPPMVPIPSFVPARPQQIAGGS
jgi:hypothetical protein